ncbi:hypothetical protein [Vibrio agarivorans]|uniref:hypothetical protein n=1 Tax=Vibrio agarivorans TaxID=153622 RepID=UPI00222F0541|nr:hypothetical protein [Vibrio agarivorans]MDN3663350.1 hypothetical protein [Vibrio agarivorans]
MKKKKFKPVSEELMQGGELDFIHRMCTGVVDENTEAISHMWDSLSEQGKAFAVKMFDSRELGYQVHQSREMFIDRIATNMAVKASHLEIYEGPFANKYIKMTVEERKICLNLLIEQYYDELMDKEFEYSSDEYAVERTN